MKKLYITLFAILALNIAKAQMTNYTTGNSGLVNNNINTIAIDAQGNVWFGSYGNGVSKFDGTNWTTYTISNSDIISNFIHTIAIDAQGNKWFGTWDGISKFDNTNWTNYTTASGLGRNNVLSIACDAQGNKWFGTSQGVSKYNDTVWINYFIGNGLDSSAQAIAIDAQGNKWIGTMVGASKFDGVNWTTYLYGDDIRAIEIDSQNNIWFGKFGGGVSKFDGTNWTNYNQSNSGLIFNNVIAIAIDSSDNKWFGTTYGIDGGISKFDGTNWTTYNQSNSGLVSNFIQSIAIDPLDNKWFGTNNGVSELSNCGIAPIENICFVEFDSSTSKNSINWATNLPANVDSIKIYNEVSTNVWSLIGEAPSSQDHFIDLNSNPFNQSYSYKISSIDSCRNESDSSTYHTTITLLAAYDQGSNAYGFTWSAYQGLAISNYYLYGIMSNGTETLIGSVPGNQYFYNYTNPYAGFVKYFIGFNTPTCSSKTNHLVKSPNSINELTDIENLITIYPNPAANKITVKNESNITYDFTIAIKNIQGQEILNEKINFTSLHSIDLSGFENGVYILTLQNERAKYVKRIIIQK